MNPDTFSEGTGLFDDVDGTVKAVLFTKEPPSESYETEGNPLFAEVSILLDGDGNETERTVSQSYSLGGKSGDNFTIADGGTGLIPENDHATVNKSTKWGIFVEALKKEGVTPSILDGGDMAALVGLYAHFNRTADKERKGLKNTRTSKFPLTTLVVTKIHALPGGKAAGKASTAAATPAAVDGEETLDGACDRFLLDVLIAKDGKVQRSQLALLASKAAQGHPRRLEISKRMADEAYLTQQTVATYDAASKGQLISA